MKFSLAFNMVPTHLVEFVGARYLEKETNIFNQFLNF